MTITLSLPYDLSPNQWEIVLAVFRSMDGWIDDDATDIPRWYGRETDDRFISASVEPSGLLLEGNLEPVHWTGWISVLCSRLSRELDMEIRDAEL